MAGQGRVGGLFLCLQGDPWVHLGHPAGPLEGAWATLAKESMFKVDAGIIPMPVLAPLGSSSYLVFIDGGSKDIQRELIMFFKTHINFV